MSSNSTIPAGGFLDYSAMRAVFRVLVIALVSLSACRPATVVSRARPHVAKPDVHVALIGATSGGSGLLATHALQGARMAFDLANERGRLPVDVIATAWNTEEDPARTAALARQIAADPTYVAAIVWPSTPEASVLRAQLSLSGVPAIDVSPAMVSLRPSIASGVWVNMVAPDSAQARLASTYLARLRPDTACVISDTSGRGSSVSDAVARDLRRMGVRVPFDIVVEPQQSDYSAAAASVAHVGCDVLFWGAGGTEAGVMKTDLASEHAAVQMVGSDMVKTEAFLESAGQAGWGTVAVCSCGDESAGTDLAAQSFVQQYQVRYGAPPAAYAVEGWDAGSMVVNALAAGKVSRSAISTYLSGLRSLEGVAGVYRFGSTQSTGEGVVELYRDSQGAWVQLRPRK